MPEFTILINADEPVHFRHFRFQLRFVTLRQAAHDYQFLQAALFQFSRVQDRINRFGFGTFNKAAGIDNDRFCYFSVFYYFLPAGLQYAEQVFRIHQVLCASQ